MDQFIVLTFYLLALTVYYPDPMSVIFGLIFAKIAISWIRSRWF